MTTNIIVIKYDNYEVEKNCIKSVIDNTSIFYHLTIFENYPFKFNLGKLWNRLIRHSVSDYICLLNSDTIVEKFWLSRLLDAFKRIKNVGCVGPSTDNSHNPQSGERPKEAFVDFSKYEGMCLSGFCLVFPKSVWEEVGGFPEDFGFYGQEVAFIDKIVKRGYKQIWRTDVFVKHLGGATVKKSGMNELKERRMARKKIAELRNENKGI